MDLQSTAEASGRDVIDADSLLQCCKCKGRMHDPMLLDCLHNVCRRCPSESCADRAAAPGGFLCPACLTLTKVSQGSISNDFILTREKISTLRAGISYCRSCEEDGKQDSYAEFWCAKCSVCLCAWCLGWHNKVTSGHRVFGLEDIHSWTVSSLIPVRQCAIHKLPIALYCSTCRLPKCVACAATCFSDKHATQVVEHERTERHLRTVQRAANDAHKKLSLVLSHLLDKIRSCAPALRQHRRTGLSRLLQHKLSLVNAIERGLDGSTEAAHNGVDSAIAKSHVTTQLFRKKFEILSFVTDYCDICQRSTDTCCLLIQKRRLQTRMYRHKKWTDSLASLWLIRMDDVSFTTRNSLPLTADLATAAWVGRIAYKTAQLAPLQFGQPAHASFGSFRLPFDCEDMVVTSAGRLLVAAWEDGLREYSYGGLELSSWKPERQGDRQPDMVTAVKEAADGRAVVGTFNSRLVVLLSRRAAGGGWQVDRRVAVFQSPPRWLSVHGDLLAATEGRSSGQGWVRDNRLLLVRLSSGQLLYTQSRQYGIRSLAVTATAVVTGSGDAVKLSRGRELHVVESHSHAGQLLWRHEMSGEEFVPSLCATPTGSIVFMVMIDKELVRAVWGGSGKKVKDVISSSSHGLERPLMASLSAGQQTVLAVLSITESAVGRQYRTVTLYPATTR